MSRSHFTYEPLAAASGSIRLIRLLPHRDETRHDKDTNSDPVSCMIFHTTIESAQSYTALSYAWGDPTRDHPILLNDATYTVTKNLFDALRYLRQQSEHALLWIDAIAIDQDNESEKTQQVQQMQQIYGNAASVLVWLGVPEDDSDTAMHWIERFGSLANKLRIGSTPQLRLRYLFQWLHSNGREHSDGDLAAFLNDLSTELTSTETESRNARLALIKFLLRPFWSRIWIAQEMFHGRSLTFRCGDISVSEDNMHHALRLLRNFTQIYGWKPAGLPQIPGISRELYSFDVHNPINVLKVRRGARRLELMYLIRSLRYLKATDPRDKIFALLSMSIDATSLQVQPDYSRSTQQVYIDATIALLRNGYWDILSYCHPDKIVEGLPLWVPDFSSFSGTEQLQQRALNRSSHSPSSVLQPQFSASGKDGASSADVVQVNTTVVAVPAKYIGRVSKVGSEWQPKSPGIWMQDLVDCFQGTEDDSADCLGSVCRTAVADQEIRLGNSKPRISHELVEKGVSFLKSTAQVGSVTPRMLRGAGLAEYYQSIVNVADGRRPFSSENHIGIGPWHLEVGDLLYCFNGSQVPHAVRRIDQSRCLFVGEIYLNGWMDGKVLDLNLPNELLQLH